jgi:hypothetical protein
MRIFQVKFLTDILIAVLSAIPYIIELKVVRCICRLKVTEREKNVTILVN